MFGWLWGRQIMSPRLTSRSSARRIGTDIGGKVAELALDGLEDGLVVVDEVHLVDAQHEVGHAEQRREERVPARLFDDALAGVDEYQREIGRRRARHHVARVLHVPGRVRDD